MAGGGAEARGTGLFLVGAGGGVGSVGCEDIEGAGGLGTAAGVHGGTAAGFRGGAAAGLHGGAAAGFPSHGGVRGAASSIDVATASALATLGIGAGGTTALATVGIGAGGATAATNSSRVTAASATLTNCAIVH